MSLVYVLYMVKESVMWREVIAAPAHIEELDVMLDGFVECYVMPSINSACDVSYSKGKEHRIAYRWKTTPSTLRSKSRLLEGQQATVHLFRRPYSRDNVS